VPRVRPRTPQGHPLSASGCASASFAPTAGVSLSELARRSGLGKGTLSELERGQRNPTLETLFAITTALGASLSDVPVGHEERPIAARSQGESVDARLLDRWENDGVTEVYDVRIRPRLQESEPHAPGVRETLTILTGRAEVGAASAPALLLPGQSVTFAADRRHVYRGLDDATTGILIMRYPPRRP